jgi:FixJ family two-component response regulator
LPADGFNGIQTLEKAKELKMKLPPVIFLTGFLDPSIEKKARDLGVFEFLTKDPLSGDDLRETVTRALNLTGDNNEKD